METKRKYKNIHDQNIILLFSGELTFELQSAIISSLDQRIDKLESDRKIKKKFYNVATECIQNLLFHAEEAATDNETIMEYETKSVTIVVYATKKFFMVQTSNYVLVQNQASIADKLDDVNSKTEDELREAYKVIMANQGFSDKGTAGLGYVDIARKSKNKIDYEFFQLNNDYSLFTLTSKVSRSE